MSFYVLGILGSISLGSLFFSTIGDAVTMQWALSLDALLFALIVATMLMTGFARTFDNGAAGRSR